MKKHGMNFKRLTAFWLGVTLLIGSVYTSNNYSSYADQKAQEILENFKAENSKSSDSGSSVSSDGITSVKATAANSDEITDGEVYNDNATDSNAVEDGEIATASNANAFAVLKSSANKVVPEHELYSYIKLPEDSIEFISSPDDFGICKYGTKTICIEARIDSEDIPGGLKESVGGEIIIPKGFTVNEEASSSLKSNTNWDITINNNDSDSDTVIAFKGIRSLTYIVVQFYVEQDELYLLDNLSTYSEYKFVLNLYGNYENEENRTCVVENLGDDETSCFSLSADDYEEATWTNIDIQNNGRVYTPKDLAQYPDRPANVEFTGDGSYLPYYRYNDSQIGSLFDKGIVVKYHKTRGYIKDDVIFKFMTEKLPKGNYCVCIRYVDDNGNIIYIPVYDDNTSDYWDRYYHSTFQSGEYKLQESEIINQITTTGTIKKFATPRSISGNYTYGEILYNAGTLEIMLLPNIRCNQLFYENEWDADNTITVTSEIKTAVLAENGDVKVEGDPITIKMKNGTYKLTVNSVSASNLDGTTMLQYPYWLEDGDDYMDTKTSQPIKITWSDNRNNDWKFYDDFIYTVEYKGPSGAEEALYPVKLTNLQTRYEYGLSYRIYIKDARTGEERVDTIVGRKNSSSPAQYYDDLPAVSIQEKKYNGRTTWDGTSGETKLGENEYVPKIEIIKSKLATSYIRTDYSNDSQTLGYTILRAQNKKIDGSGIDIGDSVVELVATVKVDGETLKTSTQHVTTVNYIDRDTLELVKENSSRSIQINHATKETGVLGTYTLKKYSGTMDYDKNDPPVIVISGDGATIIDRVSKTNQRLLYIVDQNGKKIDVSDSTGGTVRASDNKYEINVFSEKYFDQSDFIDTPNYEHVLTWYQYGNSVPAAHRSSESSDYDRETKLYNLPLLYHDLGIKYATKLVIAQDWVNNWTVSTEAGTSWTKCFYANKIEPGYLGYDKYVQIDGKTTFEKQLTYEVELYCKASDWSNNKATDSNAGSHGSTTKKVQNLSKIVYGNKEEHITTKLADYSFVKPTVSTTYGTPTYKYAQNDETSNILAKVSVDGVTETQNNLYIDYDNVVYDFSETDPELLSITTGV